jgi:hypothetical protein
MHAQKKKKKKKKKKRKEKRETSLEGSNYKQFD